MMEVEGSMERKKAALTIACALAWRIEVLSVKPCVYLPRHQMRSEGVVSHGV